ncbi:MAG: GMC family oxidoreductase [Gemmatimonadetes bacterium]|nr:GMC family oxidoreductase [Gemmatimonadota bacterium]
MDTDVLIIGSGFGGAAFALRLAEAGFRVTVLEKGPHINPLADFRQTQDPSYLLRYLKSLSGDRLSLTYAEALGGGSGFYEMVSLRAPSRARSTSRTRTGGSSGRPGSTARGWIPGTRWPRACCASSRSMPRSFPRVVSCSPCS